MSETKTSTRRLKKSTIINEHSDKPLASTERHYLDNEKFLEALVERRIQRLANEEKGLPPPRVSEYIGECILKVAQNLGKKRSFVKYPYKDEMILDGVLACIKYVDNFSPEISKNPFAYFTQICSFAFVTRINMQKEAEYIQYRATIRSAIYNDHSLIEGDEDAVHAMDNLQFNNDFMEQFVDDYEKKKAAKKAAKPKKGLRALIVEDDEDKPEVK